MRGSREDVSRTRASTDSTAVTLTSYRHAGAFVPIRRTVQLGAADQLRATDSGSATR